jgi:methionine transaminase
MLSKLPHVGTTIFTTMSKMAGDYNAINLSQGIPNFPTNETLIDLIRKNAGANIHQYAPMAGLPSLLEGISNLIYTCYQRNLNPSGNILVTAGATQAIFTTIQALVHKDDEVIILDPSYDCYEAPVILAGAKAIRIPLNKSFLPDWNEIFQRTNYKTRLIITNNPHNPSGTVWTENDIRLLEKLILQHPNLTVLSDEVYEFITFEKPYYSVNSSEILRDRAVIVSSFGKTFHITGWKIGYIIAPEKLMIEIKKVHQFLVFSVNSLAQACISDYLKVTKVESLGNFYKIKRDFFREKMKSSRFELLPCDGTYFQVASYKAISSESDLDFSKRLITQFGVAAIPLSVFNSNQDDQKLIRFCFAKDEQTLILATERLCKI